MSLNVEYYGATWCKVCVEIKPALEKICSSFGVNFVQYDIDELEGDERVADITKVPTVRVYQDNKLIETITTKHVDAINSTLSKHKKITLTDDF
jgi:thiol-disulfide isomerase/thioredoxin